MILQVKFGKGFTLIELIAVVVLLSILGVAALARLGNTTAFEEQAFFNDTVNALRYAQKLAVSTGCNVQVAITNAGFTLNQQVTSCTTGAYTLTVVDPANRAIAYANKALPVGGSIATTGTMVFTPASNVTGLTGAFTVAGSQFTVHQTTGLVSVP